MREVLLQLMDDDGGLLGLMRRGLAGLTDVEYFWEPVDDCWSVRRRGELRTAVAPWKVVGKWALDVSYPDPEPSPFTTIAWRLVHMIGSVRVASATIRGHRREDGAIDDIDLDEPVPGTAKQAVGQWWAAVAQLRQLLTERSSDDLDRLERQWWDATGQYEPVWKHVLYFGYFEPASHGAEVRLLRDLFRHTRAGVVLHSARLG